jgi:DnaJ-class molecular chaperone
MHDPLLQDYLDGEPVELNMTGPFKIDCAFCSGTGVHPGTMGSMSFERCPACRGLGIIEIQADRKDFCTCEKCQGTGKDPDSSKIDVCNVCGGLGIHAFN